MVSFLGGAAGGATVSIVIQAINKYSSELNNAEKEFKIFGQGIGISTAKMAALGATVGIAVSYITDATKEFMNFEERFTGFSRLIEGDSKRFLQTLEMASNNTISKMDLVTASNKAMMLGIRQDMLPTLAKASDIISDTIGTTGAEAFERLSYAISASNERTLKQMGIQIDVQGAYKAYADSINKTVEALTDEQKQMIFAEEAYKKINEQIKELDDGLTSNADKIEQVAKQWADLKLESGKAGATLLGVSGILEVLNAGLKTANNLMQSETWTLMFKHPLASTQELRQIQERGEYTKYLEGRMERPFGLGINEEQELEGEKTRTAMEKAEQVFAKEQEIKDFLLNAGDLEYDEVVKLKDLIIEKQNAEKAGIEANKELYMAILENISDKASELQEKIRTVDLRSDGMFEKERGVAMMRTPGGEWETATSQGTGNNLRSTTGGREFRYEGGIKVYLDGKEMTNTHVEVIAQA